MKENASIDRSTVLVTGATGFIGNNLVARLLSRECTVHCLVRKTSNVEGLKQPNVHLSTGDLLDPLPADLLQDVQFVFHCAGLTRANGREEYFRANTQACEVLYKSCKEHANKIQGIVHLSSLAAVGPSSLAHPVHEESPCHPVTHYGKSKLAGEVIARHYAESLPIVILRPPVVYGPREKNIFTFFKSIARGWNIEMGTRERVLSLIHVEDLIDAMLTAAEKPAESGSAFFITDGNEYPWAEVARKTASILQVEPRTIHISEKWMPLIGIFTEFYSMFNSSPPLLDRQKMIDIRQSTWTASSEKFFKHYQFEPRYDLKTGLEQTLGWYKENRWL